MTTKVLIMLEIDGDPSAVHEAVEAALDAGALQDAINEYDSDDGAARVISATSRADAVEGASAEDFAGVPTRSELEAAYARLRAARVTAIADINLSEIARLSTDSAYVRSPAEMRLARGLLWVRAGMLPEAAEGQTGS